MTVLAPDDPRSRVRCLSCGYSLVGAPTSRCPECGEEWTLEAAELDARKNLSKGERRHDVFLAVLFGLGALLTGFVAWIIYRTHAVPGDWGMAVLIAMLAFSGLMAWFSVECVLTVRRRRRGRVYAILWSILKSREDS